MFSTSYNVPSCNPRFVTLLRMDGRKYKDPVAYASMSKLDVTILISMAFKLNRSAYNSGGPRLLLKLGKPWVAAPNERLGYTDTREQREGGDMKA
jgi:hypothetical protein